MIKICFCSYSHPFDDMRILYKEARSLAAAGYNVTHLAPGGPTAPESNGVTISTYKRGNRFQRFYWLLFLVFRSNAEVLHCNEVESWLIGLMVKLVRPGTRVIFDVHEHYPSRFDQTHLPEGLKTLVRYTIKLVFYLLTPATDFFIYAKRSVAGDFPVNGKRYEFVFNYSAKWSRIPQLEEVPNHIREIFRSSFTAIHIGDLSRARGWPQLIEALLKLRDETDISVVCLGGVQEGLETFEAEAKRLGVLQRIIIIPKVPYEEVFQYLVCANCGLMLYQPGIQNHVFAFPMKMYDYMAAGLPMIGPGFAVEVAPVFKEYDCGVLIDTADSSALAESLRSMYRYRDRTRRQGEQGQRAVNVQFTWEAQETKLLGIYFSLRDNSIEQV